MPPTHTNASTSTTIPGARSTAVPASARPPTAGGSLRRWASSTAPPAPTATAAASSPAAGDTLMASSVTSSGPAMKTTSSKTDSREYAVCRRAALRGSPASTYDHRARTRAPNEPMVAPIPAAAAKNVHSGAFVWAATTTSSRPTTWTVMAGRITLAWPNRSTARATTGVATAWTTPKTAATAPATP